MHELIHVPDHNIVAINRGNKENESNTILYKDKRNRLHTIDLDICVENFQKITESKTADVLVIGISQGVFSSH